jgi:predicted secreted protein
MTEIAAKGTLLQRADVGDVAFTTIAQVRSITGPGMSADMIDSSHHSTVNFWRTMLPGFKSGGEVTMDLLFDPAEPTHNDAVRGLVDDLDTGDLRLYQIILPDAGLSEWAFSAYVSALEISAPHEDALTASCTLTISGQPVLTTP